MKKPIVFPVNKYDFNPMESLTDEQLEELGKMDIEFCISVQYYPSGKIRNKTVINYSAMARALLKERNDKRRREKTKAT